MITEEDILQELMRRGIDPNQIPPPQAPAPQPKQSAGYYPGYWGAFPGHDISEPPVKPDWAMRHAPQLTGGATGVLGTAIGGPALGIPLAALGGAAGKAMQQGERMDRGEGIPLLNIFKEQGKAALWEGGTEAIFPTVSKLGKKVVAPMARKVIPKAAKLSDKLADYGSRIMKSKFAKELTEEQAEHLVRGGRVHITAAGQTTDPLLDHVEEMMRGSLLGSDLEILRNYLHPKALKVARSEFSEGLWKELGRKMSPRDVGYLFRQAVENKEGFAKKIISALYKNLDDAARGAAKVDLRPAKAEALLELDRLVTRMGKGPAKEVKILAKQIASLPDTASFSDAIFHHSDILYIQRSLQARAGELAPKNPQAARFVKKIQSIIDDSMKRTAAEHSPEMVKLHEAARAAKSKLHKDILSNDFIKGAMKLAEKKPEDIAPFVFKSFNTAQAVHKVVGPKTWKKLVASQMEEILQAAAKETAGEITETAGEQVIRGRVFLDKFESLGDDVLNEMFPTRGHIEAIREFGQMHRLVQDPVGAAGGKMLIKLVQAGAIVGTALGKFTGTSGVILLGPKALSKLMASEMGIRWLTTGLKTPAASPVAGAILVRILREAGMPEAAAKARSEPKWSLDVARGKKPKHLSESELLLKTTK